jgi:PH (Pleckstrin Homology) domain-containing protein
MPAGPATPAGAVDAAAGSQQATAWRTTADGARVFRMQPPVVLWWAWVAVAVFALGDLAVQEHDRGAIGPALGIALVTGLVYACAWRPRVIADDDGVTVQNPLRDYRVPWGAVNGIFLADSVELQCARQPPKDDKTIYSWALYGSRRSRARAGLRTRGWDKNPTRRPQGYARLPSEAQEALKQVPAEAMARELGRLSTQARARGAVGGTTSATWAWPGLAAILIPAAALALALLL